MKFDSRNANRSVAIFILTFIFLFMFMLAINEDPRAVLEIVVFLGTLGLIYLVGGYSGKDE